MGRPISHNVRKESFKYDQAAVASDRKECSEVGALILKQKGSAVDAAISTLLCLGVLHLQSSGLGGGGYMMIANHSSGQSEVIDFRETAPECVTNYLNITSTSEIQRGGLSVAVPAEIFGMHAAWKKFGRVPWKSLFEPVIKIAREGFVIGEAVEIAAEKWIETIRQDTQMSKILISGETLKKQSTSTKNEELSRYLSTLSNLTFDEKDIEKRREIYATMADEIRKHGGCVSAKDIENYQVKTHTPLRIQFGTLQALVSQGSSSGPIIAFILNIFDELNLSSTDLDKRAEIVYSYFVKSFELAFKLRQLLGDPDFDSSMEELISEISSKNLAKDIVNSWKNNRTLDYGIWRKVPTLNFPLKTGTTHVSVVDSDNNVVGVTSTVNGYFGSFIASEAYGFVYNNEMDDFSFPNVAMNEFFLPSSAPNYPSPGKRPISSSSPVIILDQSGNPIISVGGAGGSMIISSVAQVLLYHVMFGLSAKDAVDRPRLHFQNTPNIVVVEPGFSENVIQHLRNKGYEVEVNSDHHAVVQMLAKLPKDSEWRENSYRKTVVHSDHDAIYAVSDYRKGGYPAGY